MICIFHPQPLHVRPLNQAEAEKQMGEGDSSQDLAQVQKLFTCQHGITVNWKQARSALGLPFRN